VGVQVPPSAYGVADGNWHTYDTQNIVLLGSSPRLPIGEKMSIEEAFNYIFEELQKSFSILEEHGLIETLWDESGESSIRPTQKLMDMERKGILRDYVQEIFPKEE